MAGASNLTRSLVGCVVAGAALFFGAVSPWSRAVLVLICAGASVVSLRETNSSLCDIPRDLWLPVLLTIAYLAIRMYPPPGIARYAAMDGLCTAIVAAAAFLLCASRGEQLRSIAHAAGVVVWWGLALFVIGGEAAVDGWFHNRNIFALYTLMGGVLCLNMQRLENGEPDWFARCTAGASVLLLVLLRSYAALASFAAVGIAPIIRVWGWSPTIPLAVFVGGVSLTAVLQPSSVLDRVIWTVVAFRIWARNLLWGVGPGMFGFFYPEFSIGLPAPETATTLSHNLYAGIAAETGVWGLFLCSVTAYALWGQTRSVSRERVGAAGSAIGAALLCSVADYGLLVPMNAVLFAALVGCAVSPDRSSDLDTYKPRSARGVILWTALCTVAGIGLCVFRGTAAPRPPGEMARAAAMRYAASGDRPMAIALLRAAAHENPRDAEIYAIAATLLPPPDRFAMFRTAVILNPRAAQRYARMVRERS